jgi:hypothetical protein
MSLQRTDREKGIWGSLYLGVVNKSTILTSHGVYRLLIIVKKK